MGVATDPFPASQKCEEMQDRLALVLFRCVLVCVIPIIIRIFQTNSAKDMLEKSEVGVGVVGNQCYWPGGLLDQAI